MAVKTTGAEFKRYYSDNSVWPEGWYHEGDEITVNGKYDEDADLSTVDDHDVIVIRGGVIMGHDNFGIKHASMESHFKKWRKAQMTELLIVEVPKDKTELVIAAIIQAGAKVVR